MTKINSVKDIRQHTFDSAELVDLYSPFGQTDFKGIRNLTTGKVVATGSSRYALVTHNTIKEAVVSAMENQNIGGYIRDFGNNMSMEIYFKDSQTASDDSLGVKVGLRIQNSYTKQSGLRVGLYAFRLVCTNGMVVPRSLHKGINKIHVGEININELKDNIANMVDIAASFTPRLTAQIEKMMDTKVDRKTINKYLKERFAKKHRKEIAITLADKYHGTPTGVSVWDVYNAITDYATHQRLKMTAFETINKEASKLLEKPIIKVSIVED